MNYYERHIGDWIRDTVSLSMLEDGAYNRLVDQCYQSEKSLPAARKEVYRLARANSGAERKAVDYVLEHFFELTPAGFVQKRVNEEIKRFQDKQRKASASANARWSKGKPTSDGDANASADAMRTHQERTCEDDAKDMLSRHQTPDTSNQINTDPPNPPHSDGPVDPEKPPGSVFPKCEPTTRPGHIAALLRDGEIQCTSMQPIVLTWAADPRVTDEILVEAALIAKKAKPGDRIGTGYLAPIVQRLIAPPPQTRSSPAAEFPAWRVDDQQCDRLGKALGMTANAAETYAQYRQRIGAKLAEIREREAA